MKFRRIGPASAAPPPAQRQSNRPAPTRQDEAAIRAAVQAHEAHRVAEVFASDASKGRDALAARLLTNPKLEAGEIIAILAGIPAVGAGFMLATLHSTPNSDLGR